MAVQTPYDQLIGTWKVYVGPVGEAKPDVDEVPAGNWVELGPTDEAQELRYQGTLTYFRDNDHSGAVKAIRPEESIVIAVTVVGLTVENYAKILHSASNVVTEAGPPATKKIPHKRGFYPSSYALLLRGESDSPYGNFPGQHYFPYVVTDGEPTETRTRDGRSSLMVEWNVMEYDAADDGEEMGIWEVQTA